MIESKYNILEVTGQFDKMALQSVLVPCISSLNPDLISQSTTGLSGISLKFRNNTVNISQMKFYRNVLTTVSQQTLNFLPC